MTIATVLSIVLCRGAESRAADAKVPPSPYPDRFEPDGTSKVGDGLASRIVYKPLSLGFRLVPRGEYRIGDDDQEDSAAIRVRMKAFYVAERELSFPDVAKLVRARRGSLQDERHSRTDVVMGLLEISETMSQLSGAFPHDPLQIQADETGLALTRGLGKDGEKDASLSPEEMDRVREVDAQFQKMLLSLEERRGATFDRAHFATAVRLAEECNAHLPTEAQWEVAARTFQGAAGVTGLLDDTLEWCTDYYSADYFRRSADFADPVGPARGKLSEKQRRDEARSAFPQLQRWTRSARVIRGRTVSERAYAASNGGQLFGAFIDDFAQPKGVRLVVKVAEEK